jgi:hypothetical protein
MGAFSNNQSYQQSPPNMRAKGNGNTSKLSTIAEKKQPINRMGNSGKNTGQGLYIGGGQTNNSLLLPMAPGAQGPQSTNAKAWNQQAMGHTMTHAQANSKNKDRYIQNRDPNQTTKQQFYMANAAQNGVQIQSVDMVQSQLSAMHQSPTLSP